MTATRKIFLFLVFCAINTTVHAQQLAFPFKNMSDSVGIRTALKELGLAMTRLYKDQPVKDRIAYYSNLFRFEMMAENYPSSLKMIDTLRSLYKDPSDQLSAAFPFYVFAATMKKSENEGVPFERAFDELFYKEYKNLPFKAATVAENYYAADLLSRQQRFLELISDMRSNPRDSISFTEASSLCFFYLNHLVYTAEIPRARPILQRHFNDLYVIDDSVMIMMRDGAKISATIVRSRKVAGAQPVIFKFGIYAEISKVTEARFIASHGYTALIADTRGKRLSNDELRPFEHDATDAYDIIDWISQQNWCNGKVGMYGGSYLGFTQWAATKKIHPALKTIVPQVAVGIGVDFPGVYGVMWTDMLRWIHIVSNNKLTDWNVSGNKTNWETVLANGIAKEGLLILLIR